MMCISPRVETAVESGDDSFSADPPGGALVFPAGWGSAARYGEFLGPLTVPRCRGVLALRLVFLRRCPRRQRAELAPTRV